MASIASRRFKTDVTDNRTEDLHRASRRIIIHAEILKASKISTGDVILVKSHDAAKTQIAVGVAWPSLNISQDTVILSKSIQLTARLNPGDSAQVIPLSGPGSHKLPPGIPSLATAQAAAVVRLKEISRASAGGSDSKQKVPQRDWLQLLLRESLVDLKYITNDQVIEISYDGDRRTFSVQGIFSQHEPNVTANTLTHGMNSLSLTGRPAIWTIGWDCSISVSEDKSSDDAQQSPLHKPEVELLAPTSPKNAYATVGGLDKQIQQIRDLLELPLTRPELFHHFGLKPPRGILLHGPPGTGKTHLARAIASSTNSSVLVINGPELSSAYHGETESKLRDVFREAREKSPCIVVLDEVDALVPRREDGAGGEVEKRVVATLLTILDGIEGGDSRVIVIGTTNRPNAIDPALRRPGRFDREIEIGVPDIEARLAILQVLLADVPHTASVEDLRAFASKAHGYVGADLSAVVREGGTRAIKRWMATSTTSGTENQNQQRSMSDLQLTLDDLIASMPSVRPSAMRSLFVESPNVRYSDIGGQGDVIQKLREAVEWPLLHPEAFQRLGVRPPKGVLLYGPPGCSKTVLARACACESGVNFIAVKGPELLNKFVGESERAVREIFRKARAASPAIVFFDEIDALASSRSTSETDTGSSHEGVLTSLLNEMDGVNELVGVTILAATNRPHAMDTALMRPGRLDRILFVGPPDQAAREEILRIRTRTMTVQSDINLSEIARLSEGCSGAEVTALCQEAALMTMRENIDAPFIPQEAFCKAARSMKRQITPTVLQTFQQWTQKTQGTIA